MATMEKPRSRATMYSIPRIRGKAFKQKLEANRRKEEREPKLDYSMVKRLSEKDAEK